MEDGTFFFSGCAAAFGAGLWADVFVRGAAARALAEGRAPAAEAGFASGFASGRASVLASVLASDLASDVATVPGAAPAGLPAALVAASGLAPVLLPACERAVPLADPVFAPLLLAVPFSLADTSSAVAAAGTALPSALAAVTPSLPVLAVVCLPRAVLDFAAGFLSPLAVEGAAAAEAAGAFSTLFSAGVCAVGAAGRAVFSDAAFTAGAVPVFGASAVPVLFLPDADLPVVFLAVLGLADFGAESALAEEGEALGEVLEAGEGGAVFSAVLAAVSGAVAVFPRAVARVLGLEGFGLGSPEFWVSVTGVSWSLVMKVLWLRGGFTTAKNFSSMP